MIMKKIFTLIALALCTTAFGQIYNGGMENWRTYTVGSSPILTIPDYWSSIDSIVYTVGPLVCPTCTLSPLTFQSDTPHSGSYAAEIMTKYFGGTLGYAEGLLTNCQVNFNLATEKESISGGSATTVRTDTVTAWIKFVPVGGDSGAVNIEAVLAGMGAGGADSIVGNGQDITIPSGGNYILASPVYTMHTYVITYTTNTVVPDHIQISFHTSYHAEHDSTTMYIDDVEMNMPGSTASVQLLHSNGFNSYPNPAGNTLHIQAADHMNATAELYNMLGQLVAIQTLTAYITDLDISKLSPGMYYMRLLSADNKVIYNTKVVKQ
jgi:hypothetical protein